MSGTATTTATATTTTVDDSRSSRHSHNDAGGKLAVTVFWAAFDGADATFAPTGVSNHTAQVAALQTQLLSALVACATPHDVASFLLQAMHRLDAMPPFSECAKVDAAAVQTKWTWLMTELRQLADVDAMRFNDDVENALQQMIARVDSGNQHRLEIHIRVDEPASQPLPEATAWDVMTRFVNTNSRSSLRRLMSGSSADGNAEGKAPPHIHTRTLSRRRLIHAHSADEKIAPLLQQGSSNSVTDNMPTVVRAMTARMGVSTEETFLCLICYENCPVGNSFELSACGHRFCVGCFKTYIELKIKDGQIFPACFHQTMRNEDDGGASRRKACGVAVAPVDMECVVSPEVWKKYLTFKFNKEHEYARQCPFCEHSQVCSGPEHPECVCVSCSKTFCFTHGNAHVDGSCADYEMTQIESEKLNRAAIADISKPCPGCKNNVEKSGGCNHMTCIVCQTNFCWICGAIVDGSSSPDHFQWWNLRGCAGRQMDDTEGETRCGRILSTIFRVAFFVIIGPPAFVITVALTIVSCFCLPCMKIFDVKFVAAFTTCLSLVGMTLFLLPVGILMATAACVTLVLALVCGICCSPFRLRRSQAQGGQASADSTLNSGGVTIPDKDLELGLSGVVVDAGETTDR